MAGSDFVITGSRLQDDTRTNYAAEDADYTLLGTDSDQFIFCAMVEVTKHGGATGTLQLRWRNVTDSGTFAALSASGELTWSATTNLVNGNGVTSGEAVCTPSAGTTYDNGVEREGANDVSTTLAQDHYTEHQWAIDGSGMLSGKQYEFEIYDSTAGASLGTALAQITSATTVTTMPADSGTYSMSGTAAVLLKNSAVIAASGSYSVTGTAVGFTVIVPSSTGSYAITGTDVALTKAYNLVATSGSFSVTGTDTNILNTFKRTSLSLFGVPSERHKAFAVHGATNYSLVCDSGSYAVTGTAAALLKGYSIVAASGSYSVTGTAVAFLVDYNVIATSGTYTVTGTTALLEKNYLVAAALGTYSVSGTAVVFFKGYALAAASGVYSVSGTDANLEYNRVLPSASGTYSVSGSAALLTKGFVIPASSGTYTETGTDVALVKDYTLVADSGSYSVSGTAVAFVRNYNIVISSGSYSLTGTAVALSKTGSYTLVVDSGSYGVTGTDVALLKASTMPATTGSYSVTGTSVVLSKGFTVAVDSGSYSVTGTDVAFTIDYSVPATSGTYGVTGTDTALVKSYVLTADSGSYGVTGTSAILIRGYTLVSASGSYGVTGTSVAVLKASSLVASSGTFSVSGTAVVLTYTPASSAGTTRLGITGIPREPYAVFTAKTHTEAITAAVQASTATTVADGVLHEIPPAENPSPTRLGLMGVQSEAYAGFVAKAAGGGPSTITGSGTPQADPATTSATGSVNFVQTSSDVKASNATASGSGGRLITGTTWKDSWFSKYWGFSRWFSSFWFSRGTQADTATTYGLGGEGTKAGQGNSPQASSATVSGSGIRTVVQTTGAVQATQASVTGLGVETSGNSGYGYVKADNASTNGYGVIGISGSGTPQATTARAAAIGYLNIAGSGVAKASTATVNISANYLRIRPMAQYLEIVNEIIDELNEVRLTSANFNDARNIQRYVKSAVNRAYQDIHNLEYKWPWTTFSSPTDNQLGNTFVEVEAGTRWYLLNDAAIDIDSDYGYVDWEHFMLTTEGVVGETAPYTVRKLSLYPTEEWQDHYAVSETQNKSDSSSYGTPNKVMKSPDGRRFGLSPIPDKAYRIYFTAYNQITLLTYYDDEVIMPSQWIPVLVARARYYAWQFKQDPQQAALADADFKNGLKQMRRALNPMDQLLTDDRLRAV